MRLAARGSRALPAEQARSRADGSAAIEELLCARIAGLLGIPTAQVRTDVPLAALGFDSLAFIELRHELESWLGTAPPLAELIEEASVASLVEDLGPLMAAAPTGPDITVAAPEGTPAAPAPSDAETAATGLPLSYGQRALWFLERLAPGVGAYHVAAVARVTAAIDRGAFEGALRAVCRRHPVLRTVIDPGLGEPCQRVLAELEPELRWLPLRETANADDPAAERDRILSEEVRRPFDLARGPLLRVSWLALGEADHAVAFAIHHVAADFWSMAVLVRELGQLYRQQVGGPAASLEPLAVRYADFVRWQDAWVRSAAGERALAYWQAALQGVSPLALCNDRPRAAVKGHRGGAMRLRLDGAVTARLHEVSRGSGATLFMSLLAGFQALLHRYGAGGDFAVGCPATGRSLAAFAPVVGYFVNPLPLRADLAGSPGFATLLGRVRRTALGAFEHQDLPFPLMVERLQPERDPSRSPLFQAMLVLQRTERVGEEALAAFAMGEAGGRLEIGGLPLVSLARKPLAAQFDLSLAAAAREGVLSLCLEYDADLFDGATAGRMLRHLAELLRQASSNPALPVARLWLLSSEERAQVFREWNDTAAEVPPGECLHDRFTAQAGRSPSATAVICGEQRLSYAELDGRTNQLAHHLRRLGVGPEVKVALAVERSADLVAGVLGILKAGGAYVPLDLAYPAERLAYMLEDSGAAVLLATRRHGPALSGFAGSTVCLDEAWPAVCCQPATPPAACATPENLAYVIYTSGSTGRPKGVAIEHRSAVVLVHWARQTFSPAELAGVLASTSICFDLSVFELMAPLSWGGTVILADNALGLPRLPAAAEVTLINTVPSVCAELLRLHGLPAAVRTVCLAGEPLPEPLMRQLAAIGTVGRVLNLYGPTEDTTYSTWKDVGWRPGAPTLGRPVWRTRARVLDSRFEPVPVGVAGELFLGGAGLARGYLGRAELTAERFLPDPWSELAGEPGARLYRTGDLVRHLPDGELEYLGRADHQVKIRGHRVELGEVEATLLRHPGVRQAAVLARRDGPDGEARLVAYVAAVAEVSGLRRELTDLVRSALPAPMMPSAFVVVDALPLTPNGKIDRQALPAASRREIRPPGEARPRTPAEELLTEILAAALGLDQVAADADFFALGGHSLLAVRALARIERTFGVVLPLAALFLHPTAAGLAELLAGRPCNGHGAGGPGEPSSWLAAAPPPLPPLPPLPPIIALPRGDGSSQPLSFAQRRLWFLHQLDSESPAYHLAGLLQMTGRLRAGALLASLQELVARHEALRTSFPGDGGEPAQAVAPPTARLALARVDLEGLPQPSRRAAAKAAAESVARRPFDLARGPLVRFLLVRLAPREQWLVMVFHHIVVDGVSLEIFLRELAALYTAFGAGTPSPLAELPVRYADFAAWQRQVLTAEAMVGQLEWWRRQLADLTALELPADRPRRLGASDRGAGWAFDLGRELSSAELRAACRAAGVTPYMALLGALLALSSRLTGRLDVAVGSPIAGRARMETEGLVGLFINTLVLRASLAGDPGAGEILVRVRRVVLDAHARGEVPFERVVEELQPERRLEPSPLFEIMFTYMRAASIAARVPGLAWRFEDVETGTSKFEMSLWIRDTGEGLAAKLVYRRDLFDRATVARLAGHYRALLAGLLREPELPLSRLPLLSPAERHQLVVEWNATGAAGELRAEACLHTLFEAQAAATADAPAVLARGLALTFRELNRKANRLARRLRSVGVGPDALVGVCADRSPEMIAAVLGVWKAGGAYVPLDPAYPRERLRFMLEDSGVSALVTRPELLSGPTDPPLAMVDLAELAAPGEPAEDRNLETPIPSADNLAYVIYTSGSTGRPKGVMVRHGAVANLVAALGRACYAGGERRRVGLNASLAFDASVKQLAQLLLGHALCVVPEAVRRDGGLLAAYLAEQELDALDCTPSQLRLLVGSTLPGNAPGAEAGGGPASRLPRTVLVGGEVIGEELWRQMAAAATPEFWNVYGPTECTVDATCGRVAGAGSTIGRPLDNVRVHVLDPWLQAVPVGAPGEICIAGAGLARGYWRRPDLTALRFVPNPFAELPGERLYRSGDLGRHRPDGAIEIHGRADQQVKVRGFRIEPGEIESLLRRHRAVAQAVVLCREDLAGEPSLVAYYVLSQGGDTDLANELRALLRDELPEPMIPGAFVRLDRLPLSASGKLDRQALPPPGAAPPERGARPPCTATEGEVAAIWAALLRRERVGTRESFFELGGHSLLAAQLSARLHQVFGVELPLRQLLEVPTVEAQAAAIDALRQVTATPAPGSILARPRSRRDVAQLVSELRQLSAEEAGRRLRDRRPS